MAELCVKTVRSAEGYAVRVWLAGKPEEAVEYGIRQTRLSWTWRWIVDVPPSIPASPERDRLARTDFLTKGAAVEAVREFVGA